MKTEQCLMCIVCFVLGWFVHNVVGKCGFGREYLSLPNHSGFIPGQANPGGVPSQTIPAYLPRYKGETAYCHQYPRTRGCAP